MNHTIYDHHDKENMMSRTPQEVFESHQDAIETGNFEQLLGDYAEDAVLLTMDRAYKGKAEIAEFFQILTQFTNPVIHFDGVVYAEDLALLQWSADAEEITIPRGTAVFVIQDGLIQRQGEWFAMVPKEG
jgi:hypothetical protein